VRPGLLPLENVFQVTLSDRHLFVLFKNGTVAAHPFGQHSAEMAPLWQTPPDSGDPCALTVCGGDWLIIASDAENVTMAAVDLRGPPSDWKVSEPIALSAFGVGRSERPFELACSPDGMVAVCTFRSPAFCCSQQRSQWWLCPALVR
jgi:hypothetical protein